MPEASRSTGPSTKREQALVIVVAHIKCNVPESTASIADSSLCAPQLWSIENERKGIMIREEEARGEEGEKSNFAHSDTLSRLTRSANVLLNQQQLSLAFFFFFFFFEDNPHLACPSCRTVRVKALPSAARCCSVVGDNVEVFTLLGPDPPVRVVPPQEPGIRANAKSKSRDLSQPDIHSCIHTINHLDHCLSASSHNQ